jgi:thymidylate synthase (FAD)
MFTNISVQLVDCMGSDMSVVNAARVSMAKEGEWLHSPDVSEPFLADHDARLIGYLAKHNHWTPFSHPQVTFRIKAPIFVARQWFKHMVGITRNETSRRYVDDAPEFFLPGEWRSRPDGSIKQGSAGVHPESSTWKASVSEFTKIANDLYALMVADGVAPEQARMVLPQSMMTEWIETASLAAVCRSCALRLDPHAQLETREVAEQIAEIVAPLFPVSWGALMGLRKDVKK